MSEQLQTDDRSQWLNMLERVAEPVLRSAAAGRLPADLPPIDGRPDRTAHAPGEALCRTLAGVAPWLALGGEMPADESRLHAKLRGYALAALEHGARDDDDILLPFHQPGQTLVEAAFLGHALLRNPHLFRELPAAAQRNLVNKLRQTRQTRPSFNNWLLFSAMVETLFASVGEPYDRMRIDAALRAHMAWYKGDGVYGDGPWLHHDYYNSFVIQPMLIDILDALGDEVAFVADPTVVLRRFVRFAAVQERMIAPDGSFPVVGRSIAYRGGAFQHLAQAALQGRLPDELRPAQVRSALSAVLARTLSDASNFTADGFLQVGLCAHQPSLGEYYISRGSLYLCTTIFLPLGLGPAHPFWNEPSASWTARRVWSGEDADTDSALKDH